MQGSSFPQKTKRRVWRHIRAKQIVMHAKLVPVLVLAGMLGAGSNLTLAQEGVVKSSQILPHDANQKSVQTTAGAALSAAPADNHSVAISAKPAQTVIVHDVVGDNDKLAVQTILSVGLVVQSEFRHSLARTCSSRKGPGPRCLPSLPPAG